MPAGEIRSSSDSRLQRPSQTPSPTSSAANPDFSANGEDPAQVGTGARAPVLLNRSSKCLSGSAESRSSGVALAHGDSPGRAVLGSLTHCGTGSAAAAASSSLCDTDHSTHSFSVTTSPLCSLTSPPPRHWQNTDARWQDKLNW